MTSWCNEKWIMVGNYYNLVIILVNLHKISITKQFFNKSCNTNVNWNIWEQFSSLLLLKNKSHFPSTLKNMIKFWISKTCEWRICRVHRLNIGHFSYFNYFFYRKLSYPLWNCSCFYNYFMYRLLSTNLHKS